MAQYFATPSWLGRFFTRIKLLSIEQESLVIEFKNATKQSFLIKDFNDFSQLQNRIFSAKINLTLGENSAHTTISFLNKAQAKALNIAINQYFSQALEHKINNAKALLKRTALDEYLRDSNTTILSAEVFSLSKRYQQNHNVWQGYLPSNSSQFLSVLASAKNKNDAIAQLRNKYERKQLAQRADFYNNVESNPLTNEQRLAVIRNNDKNLVLAAAGTGKTSVMVAKALDLIATKQAMPEQILVLAYNKTAAQELKTRFIKRAQQAKLSSKSPEVLTFHALGLQLLQQAGKGCNISPFVSDFGALSSWLTSWLSEQVQGQPVLLSAFIAMLDKPLVSCDTHKSKFNATQVLAILKDSGQLKHEVDKYLKCLAAIRAEQLTDSEITQRLKRQNNQLNTVQLSTNQLNTSQVNSNQKSTNHHSAAAQLLIAMHRAYKTQLIAQNCIDFDDMILQATQAVNKQQVNVPWQHILVDEFQDISAARMALLNSLIKHGHKVRFTAVGDDWQSIYRFSGGNLALTTRFNELVGSHSLTLLQKTFRYNNSISDVAGRFVMQNPEQYKKLIITHTQVAEPQVILLDDVYQGKKSLELKTQQTINTIQKHHANASIAVLSRYRYTLNKVQQRLASQQKSANVAFLTLHSAKGLEADYCIIIGLEQGKFGFPSSQQNNPLLEALLPSQDTFAYSEERRLLYVGLTRAKHKAYLIADAKQPSLFVKELINDNYPIHIASTLFSK